MDLFEKASQLGLVKGSIHRIPCNMTEQRNSRIPFVNNVRLAADREGLKNANRIVKITDLDLIEDQDGTHLAVMGRIYENKNMWNVKKVVVAIL